MSSSSANSLTDPFLNPVSLAPLLLDPTPAVLHQWLHRLSEQLGWLLNNRELNRAIGLGDVFRAQIERATANSLPAVYPEHLHARVMAAWPRPELHILLILVFLVCHETFTQVRLPEEDRLYLQQVNHHLGVWLTGHDRSGQPFGSTDAAGQTIPAESQAALHDATCAGFAWRMVWLYRLTVGAPSTKI